MYLKYEMRHPRICSHVQRLGRNAPDPTVLEMLLFLCGMVQNFSKIEPKSDAKWFNFNFRILCTKPEKPFDLQKMFQGYTRFANSDINGKKNKRKRKIKSMMLLETQKLKQK